MNYSAWKTAADHARQERRRYRSLLWWVFCSAQLRVSWLGYRGYCKHMRRLQVRILWNVLLPEYGREIVTWWHVFGLRRFSTPLPPAFSTTVEMIGGIYYFRFFWNEA